MRRSAALLLPLALAACGGRIQPGQLAGTSWQLVELRSNDDAIGATRVPEPARYTLAFDGAGQVALRLDCNRGRGTATITPTGLTGGRLEFGPVAMTRAMCPPGSLDTRVARELPFVRSYMLQGDTLRLELFADGGQQVWRRVAE